jgi:hypothetical protein
VAIVEGSSAISRSRHRKTRFLLSICFRWRWERKPPAMRVGIGYDIHRLVEGRPLSLVALSSSRRSVCSVTQMVIASVMHL